VTQYRLMAATQDQGRTPESALSHCPCRSVRSVAELLTCFLDAFAGLG
jgi:hypothetical protein